MPTIAIAAVGVGAFVALQSSSHWRDLPGMNDVASRVHLNGSDTACCKFLGVMATDALDACKAAAVAAGGGFAGVTYHTAAFARSSPNNAAYARHCYGVQAGDWVAPLAQKDVDSSRNTSYSPPPPPAPLPADTERVFYLGDPQIGFGRSGWQEDETRFAAAAKAAHAVNATAVVVAGDLINVWNNATLTGGFLDIWPRKFDRGRVHLIPGNHDVNSADGNLSNFQAQLGHYRSTFGVDYHSFRTQHATFVMVNSESLISPGLGFVGKPAATSPWLVNETETQWKWLEAQLAAANAKGTGTAHTILVSHHPPFLKSPTEADVYWNWPMPQRTRLLGLLVRYGVKHALCGHTHTTTNRTVGGLSIYTVAGTARAFDNNGCGHSVLDISPTSVSYRYVRQTDPALIQCSPTLLHPDFEDNPALSRSWAETRWVHQGWV
eukprot:SAG31_NODE_3047_length_4749_cov_3.010968_1_plen_436_part_00